MADSESVLAPLEAFLDSLGVAGLCLDAQSRVLGWNRHFLRFFPHEVGRIRRGGACPEVPGAGDRDPACDAEASARDRPLRTAVLPVPGVGSLHGWVPTRLNDAPAADSGTAGAPHDAPVQVLFGHGAVTLGGLGAFLDALCIGCLGLDEAARTLGWNTTFLRMFPEQAGRIRPEEPYAANLRRFYRARLDPAEAPNIETYVADGVERHARQTEPFEFLHRGRWLRVAVLPVQGVGRLRAWAVAQPPQDGARIAAQMAHSGKLSALDAMERIADGLMVRDAADRIVMANRPFADIYGLEGPEAAIGRPMLELLDAAWDGAPDASAARRRWADNSRFTGAPFELPLPGDRWVRVRDFRSHDGSLVSTHVDVTDLVRLRRSANEAQRRAEDLAAQLRLEMEDRKRAEARTVQLARLASLSEMATGLAHELNQPLAALTLAADRAQAKLLRDGAAAIPDALERLEDVAAAALRARDILDQLRRFARMEDEDATAESVDVAEAVNGALSLTRAAIAAAGIALSARLPAAPVRVMVRPAALEQAIMNLLVNAREAVTAQGAEGGAIEITLSVEDGAALLTIADTGGGFTEAAMRQGFEPFFTTKPPGKGMGIGLSVAYATIQAAGGSLALSNTDRGARVTLRLPVHAALRRDPTA